jgi:hypothetical protein
MTRHALALIFLCSAACAHAGELDRCGEYIVKGELKVDHFKDLATIYIREHATTSYRVVTGVPEKGSQLALLDRKRVQAKVRIASAKGSPEKRVEAFSELLVLPDPHEDSRDIRLIKDLPCK